MNAERLVIVFSIVTVLSTIGYAGSAALGNELHEVEAEVVASSSPTPPTPPALAARLDILARRLTDARTDIDALVGKLATIDARQVEATRLRLALLYRLETGLEADLERTRRMLHATHR
ncbi:MAG: hypothetical protein H0T89_15800 [Deltaproteobacteria bacterium]|nr:hypothetical protein [Deltaproteobacteria bacterium]MDQ3295277.1 hypothetical protein [Myxococcota bacterium]